MLWSTTGQTDTIINPANIQTKKDNITSRVRSDSACMSANQTQDKSIDLLVVPLDMKAVSQLVLRIK